MTAAAGEARVALPAQTKGLRRETPLLPVSSIAGRSLMVIVAIMTFLASLTAGTVELIADASSSWRSSISREVTIQVRPRPGRDIEAEVEKAAALARAQSGVAGVRVYSRQDSQKLLEPWLGAGIETTDLPIPRLIVVEVAGGAAELGPLRQALSRDVAGAGLDDHRLWVSRLSTMANTMVVLGLVILALVLTATGLAVAFATRGAMAGSREIIDVIHLVGATDRFVAGEFQRYFLRLGLKGGAVGGGLAIAAFAIAGALSAQWVATPGGDQIEALFGTFSLGAGGVLSVAAIVAIVAAISTVVSRLTVFRNLRGLD